MSVRLLSEEVEYQTPEAEAPAATEAPRLRFTPDQMQDSEDRLSQLMSRLPPPEPRVIVKRAIPDREILMALNGLGAILAVRLLLMLAVMGSFALAWQAMSHPTPYAIWILVAYTLTIVAPLVWLSTKRT